MIEFFVVEQSTNRIRYWTRASRLNSVPASTDPQFYHADATDKIQAYEDVCGSMRADGRSDRPVLVDGFPAIPVDARPRFRISVSKSSIEANGTDSSTVTVEFVDQNEDVVTAYNDVRTPVILDGQRWRCTYVNGVATIVFRTTESGDYTVRSCADFKVIHGPVTISAYKQ